MLSLTTRNDATPMNHERQLETAEPVFKRGWLRNGNTPGDPTSAPRCGAKESPGPPLSVSSDARQSAEQAARQHLKSVKAGTDESERFLRSSDTQNFH